MTLMARRLPSHWLCGTFSLSSELSSVRFNCVQERQRTQAAVCSCQWPVAVASFRIPHCLRWLPLHCTARVSKFLSVSKCHFLCSHSPAVASDQCLCSVVFAPLGSSCLRWQTSWLPVLWTVFGCVDASACRCEHSSDASPHLSLCVCHCLTICMCVLNAPHKLKHFHMWTAPYLCLFTIGHL